jgi:hypothetical protein
MQIRTPGAPLSSVYLNILQSRPAASAPPAASKAGEDASGAADKPAAATPRPYLARGSLVNIIA